MEKLDRMLAPGERVLTFTRFSLWTIAADVIQCSFYLFLAGLSSYYDFFQVGRMIAIGIAFAGAATMGWAVLKYRQSLIWITDRRLIAQTGWPGREIIDFPFNRLESAKVDQTLIGRIFNFGDIQVSGVGSTVEFLRCVSSPLAFKKNLETAKESKESKESKNAKRADGN